jgi:hypothetical protein
VSSLTNLPRLGLGVIQVIVQVVELNTCLCFPRQANFETCVARNVLGHYSVSRVLTGTLRYKDKIKTRPSPPKVIRIYINKFDERV